MLRRAVLILILTAALSPSGRGQPAQAREAEARGDLAAAERIYEAELQKNPSAELWHRLGLVRHLQNKYASAIPAFQQALRLDPRLWTAHLFLGIGYYRTNQFPAALESLQAADRAAPPSGQGRDEVDYWMGATQIALKRPLAGLRSLERLLARQPEHSEALELATQAYSDVSSALWNGVAERNFESPSGYEIHGHALEAEGNLPGALASYRKARELAPDRPGPGREIGRLLLWEGKAEEALVELERESKLSPSDPRTAYYFGLAAIQLSRWEDAIPALEMAVRWIPHDSEPAMALAQVYLATKNVDGAVAAAQRAVSAAPKSQAAHELLVAALSAAGDTAGVERERSRWRGESRQ